MDTLVLTISLAGLVFFGIAFFLLVCWQIIKSFIEWAKFIKRRIKHEPEPQEQYFISFVVKKEGISSRADTILASSRKIKASDIDLIRERIIKLTESDEIYFLSITHLGKE